MRRPLTTLAAVAALLGAAEAPALAIGEPELNRLITREQRKLGPRSGVIVVDLSSASTLFASGAERALVPASNEKLYVTAAALLKLGPAATLDTTAAVAGSATLDEDGRLDGNLYLIGAGDPTLGEAALTDLARRVRKAGVRRLAGGVRGDESAFDALRGGPDSGYGYDYDLGGALGALVWAHGSARNGSPALAAATRFGRALKAAGVRYSRAPAVGTMPAASGGGAAAAKANVVATWRSPTVAELAQRINVPSENFYAEMLTKALGAKAGAAGSTTAGLRVVSSAIRPFSIEPRLVDGSGLSRGNRTTPLQLVTLLAGMRKSGAATEFRASLPIAGLSGTIAKRMRGTAAAGRCRAKTGTLIGVSSLSGYCTSRGGRQVAFSIVSNGVSTYSAKKTEDRITAAIARLD
ncbi:MAG: D-alanyl-D-alanine carboxypeptidase/D-alanyl-D-alanine-endopeptidase [Baekduia sp.]